MRLAWLFCGWLACATSAWAAEEPATTKKPVPKQPAKPQPKAAEKPPPKPSAKPVVPDSVQLERDLQGLGWEQFRSVVEAIPKLKADVEKHGSAGWHFVRAKYRTHAWKKNIDRLDDNEKRQLAKLILAARGDR